ncbi:TPA: acyl carrier protein [Streptococcus suis]|nr:acyl carrier protein [Streptococcus suis]HEM6326500.1 acyl carrier protein [Streptococcus suis]
MTREQIFQKIVEMTQEEKGNHLVVAPEFTLADNIAADSVEVMEFVLDLEDEFGVDIPDSAIEKFIYLSDVVDFIYLELEKRS